MEFHEMLVETSGIVEKEIAAGKTLDQIKSGWLARKMEELGRPDSVTARWLEILYQD